MAPGGDGDLRGPAAALLAKQQADGGSADDAKPDFAAMFPKREKRNWEAQGAAKFGAPGGGGGGGDGGGGELPCRPILPSDPLSASRFCPASCSRGA